VQRSRSAQLLTEPIAMNARDSRACGRRRGDSRVDRARQPLGIASMIVLFCLKNERDARCQACNIGFAKYYTFLLAALSRRNNIF
jgi:hypothetical protein